MTKELSEKINLNVLEMFLLAALHVVDLIVSFVSSNGEIHAGFAAGGAEQFSAVLVIVLMVVYICAQIFIGFKLKANANGKNVGNAHFTVNKIMFAVSVLNVLYIIFQAYQGTNGGTFWGDYLQIAEAFAFGSIFINEKYIKAALK